MIKKASFRDAGMIQHILIHKSNPPCKHTETQIYITISLDKEKALNKIQSILMENVLERLRTQGTFPNNKRTLQ